MKSDERKRITVTYTDGQDFEDNDAIRFFKQFNEGGFSYPYLATTAQGWWWVTGQAGRLTWFGLIEFFELDNLLGRESFEYAVEWDALFDEEDEEE